MTKLKSRNRVNCVKNLFSFYEESVKVLKILNNTKNFLIFKNWWNIEEEKELNINIVFIVLSQSEGKKLVYHHLRDPVRKIFMCGASLEDLGGGKVQVSLRKTGEGYICPGESLGGIVGGGGWKER